MTPGGSRPEGGAEAALIELCAAHGIEREALGFDGVMRPVPESTLKALVDLLGPDVSGAPPAGIREVLEAPAGRACYLPADLRDARVWGLTCQLPSLVSERNCGIGDFADLSLLCRIAAAEGADFVGLNPLHALFWSDPRRVSPFFPSNRRFLNPIYVALDWVEGFAGFTAEEGRAAVAARRGDRVDVEAVAAFKKGVLRRLFDGARWPDPCFRQFCEEGGPSLRDHALFEAISEAMVAEARGATPAAWPKDMRRSSAIGAAAFARNNARDVDFHLWLQWLAALQLKRVRDEALAAGMRIGLYLDFAVGSAPDGSAAWSAPDETLPDISIGAPPDPFSTLGQDWGLAPLSPSALALSAARPYAADLAAVAKYAGAIRIDHAMGLARLWMIPHGALSKEGAYVRNPLPDMLDRVAEVSQGSQTLVIGEDLGVVPPGFRDILARQSIHRYIVYFFERWEGGFSDPGWWPRDALACVGTHDMPSFAGWWAGTDIEISHALGLHGDTDIGSMRANRERERQMLKSRLGADDPARDIEALSVQLHAEVAGSPCRLAALQLEDALGLATQVNMPGTVTEHPNWLQKLPVSLDRLAENGSFRRHTAAMRNVRPR